MTVARRHSVCTAGTTLTLHEWGDESAPALLHWLGLGTYTGAYLFELGPLMARQGLRVIALDPPGVGGSPKLPLDRYRIEDLARLLPALLDQLGLGDAVLMGHSWGGAVAAEAVCLAPRRFRGLVLLDGGYVDHSQVPAWRVSLDDHVRQAREATWRFPDREALVEVLRQHYLRLTPELAEYWMGTMEERDGELVDTADSEPMGAGLWGLVQRREPLAPRLHGAGVPVLLLVPQPRPVSDSESSELGLSPAEWDAIRAKGLEELRALPACTVVTIREAGHDLIGDAAPQVAELVGEWLQPIP